MSSHPSSSSSGSSTEWSAFPWILEQALTYPGTYEIPLRTMYTLNSTPSARPSRHSPHLLDTPSLSSSASSLNNSPQTPEFPPEHPTTPSSQPTVTDHFKQCLMEHISQLPSQPFSLPPVFITSFVRRCFTEDLCMVDFTQALTAMDYLKDLETRRRKELSAALQRLGLGRDTADPQDLMGRHPKISDWVRSMQEKDRKVEALYTQVYIGLRRWTLINEMRLEPFSKANSVAMLNTLYPPSTASPPTRQLTSSILSSQRNTFFRYITAVQQNGRGVLKNLEHQGQRPGDANGWAVVRDIVDKYLRTANSTIDECVEVNGIESLMSEPDSHRNTERRADSGVGFAPGERPATSTSNHSKSSGPSIDKPLPASPPSPASFSMLPPAASKKRVTTLERITREFRNFRNRNDVKELPISRAPTAEPVETITHQPSKGTASSHPTLRKMKSSGAIGTAYRRTQQPSHSRSGSDDSSPPEFEIDALRREQLIREAQREKERRLMQENNASTNPSRGAWNNQGVTLSRPEQKALP